MFRAFNTIVVLTLFAGLLVAMSITVRMGMRGLEHGIAANFHRAAPEKSDAKPAAQEAAVGFGHGILRQP